MGLRHPWVFSGALAQVSERIKEGDIVQVCSAEGKILAAGFYEPKSQIRVRLFHFGTEEHFPPAYWAAKLQRATALRASLGSLKQSNCYRLIHAEGDFWPGLVADVYADVVVLQLRTAASLQRKALWQSLFNEAGFKYLYLKHKAFGQHEDKITVGEENEWMGPAYPDEALIATENNLKFQIDFVGGQKTGFFIDQRDNRALLAHYAKGKSVLNAFAYSGGFSVYGLAGGANKVVSVDISKAACQLADTNVALNGFSENHISIAEDCFKYLKQDPEIFDIVVLDPPAFAKNIQAVNNATRGYKEINMAGMAKVSPGGLLFTFSCSQLIDPLLFRKIVFGAAIDAGKEVRLLHTLHQPPDHPIDICHPEGEYLKGLVLQVF